MILKLSAPSKTFLAGEYAVLSGGLALVLNSAPRFELVVTTGDGQLKGIPEGSPAWLWAQERLPLLTTWNVEFRDPHSGRGGLGASGAQFLLLHALTTFLQQSFARSLNGVDLQDVWNDHQVLTRAQGSGVDVLAQGCGKIARVDAKTGLTQALDWPYSEIGVVVVRTQQKVATHTHLAEFDRSQTEALVKSAAACVEAFGQTPAKTFIDKLKVFTKELRHLDLQKSGNLVAELEAQPWCHLAKGCGALGADTVAAFFTGEARAEALAFVRSLGLEVVATERDLSAGLTMTWSGGD